MKRFAVRSLAFALALAAGTAAAQEYYDDRGPVYDDRYGSQDDGYYGDDSDYYGQDDGAYYGQDQGGYYGQPATGYGDPRVSVNAGYGRRQPPAYDTARVISVDPIVEQARPVAQQQCWREPGDRYAQQGYRDPRYAPRSQSTGGGAVLGAIAGGVLGNSVGSGDGRKAATVLGAVIGGAIGSDIERNGRYRHRNDPYAYRGQPGGYAREVERCRTVTSHVRDERVLGYRVGYEYAGRRYETVTDYHPGSEIRVRVDVTPAG